MMFDPSEVISEIERFSEIENPSKIDQVQLAQVLLEGCINLLRNAKLGQSVNAYIIDHLRIIASSNHGFLSSSMTLDNVIEELQEEEEEEMELSKESRQQAGNNPDENIGY